jgi:hypothetical protein
MTIKSTHLGILGLNGFPLESITTYVLPTLPTDYLMSIGQIDNSGFELHFHRKELLVIKYGWIFMTGNRSTETGRL